MPGDPHVTKDSFWGGLVPTEAELARRENRPYEPASALLARIRDQRTGPQESHPGRHRKHRR